MRHLAYLPVRPIWLTEQCPRCSWIDLARNVLMSVHQNAAVSGRSSRTQRRVINLHGHEPALTHAPMNFIRLYARVLKLLGDEARLGWMLAIANMSLAEINVLHSEVQGFKQA